MKNKIFLVYLISAFSIFYLTPLSIYADILVQIFSFFGLIKIIQHKYFLKKYYGRIILILSLLIFSSIIGSMTSLDQGFYSAAIASQHIIKGFSIFFFVPWLQKDQIDINKIFSSLIKIIWIYSMYIVVVSLIDWSYIFVSPLSGDELKVTAAKYDKSLIFFGIIYYFIKFFATQKLSCFFYALILFVTTQIYDIQRGDFIFVGLVFLFLITKHFGSIANKKLLFFLPFLMLTLTIGLTEIDFERLEAKFEPLTLIIDGKVNDISDNSILVRFTEIDFATKGFSDNPILGNGLIRSSMKGKLIGNIYFYPGDIGIIGVLYTFGMIGILVFIIYSKLLLKILKFNVNLYTQTFLLYSVYIYLYTIKDGTIFYFPLEMMICLVLVVLINYNFFRNEFKT